MNDGSFLPAIKAEVLKEIPQAELWLFGSRAYGTPTEESDWDILILTPHQVTSAIKTKIHNAVFPISVQLGAFINTFVIQDREWETNPAYYSLHQTIDKGRIAL